MFDISGIPILTTRSDKISLMLQLHVMSKLISEREFQSRL